jgi:hypothetical protein
MKRLKQMLALSALLSATAIGATITIDGDKSDWAEINPLVIDPQADNLLYPSEDLLAIRVTNDGENLYFLLEYAGNPPPHTRWLLLDTDQDAATGCNVYAPGELGGEYMIDLYFDVLGDARDCAIDLNDPNDYFPGTISRADGDGFVELAIPLATLKLLTPQTSGFALLHLNDQHPVATFNYGDVTPAREPRDLTGDGKADLVLRNMDTGYVSMWAMDANVKTYLGISSLALNREVTAIGDLSGEGKADIVLRNMDTGYVFMWKMDGNLPTYHGISSLGLNKTIVGAGDLNGDGRADLVLRNKDNGYLFMWQMDGNLKTYIGISSLALKKEVVGIGDLTGDGKADIVLRNKDNGYLFMWQMDGNLKTYLGISSLPLTREVVGVADLTGDGKADLVLRNKDNNYLYMWAMDGNLKTYYGIGSLGPDRQVVQLSDLSGDGKADLVLRNTASGYMELWEMDGNLVTAKAIGPLALSREVQPSAAPSPVPAVDAIDDVATTASDLAATLSVLSNDKPNPAVLSISTVTQPANGVVVDNGDGTLSYSQNGLAKESVGMGLYKTYCKSCHNVGGFSGTDTFSYVASDGQTNDSATVTVTVNSFDPPGPWDDGGNISGSPISVCNDLPHSCKAKSDAEIQSIGRFLGEVFAP